MQKILYLLRHGETLQPKHLNGRVDVALSENGKQQMQDATKNLNEIDWLVSSPLQRCSAHGEYFAVTSANQLQLHQDLQEFDFGDWDGQDYQQLWQQTGRPHIGEFWQHPWQVKVPNGETMTDFYSRVHAWWQLCISKAVANEFQQALVITHAGVIKQLLAIICNMPKHTNHHLNVFEVPYSGLVKVSLYIDEQNQAWPKIVF